MIDILLAFSDFITGFYFYVLVFIGILFFYFVDLQL